jgi:hypothetical protein
MSTPITRKYGRSIALIAGGLVAGGVLAGGLSAHAADTPSPSSSSSSSSSASTAPTNPNPGDPSKPQRSDETLLTGTTAQKVKDAVSAKYPGATFVRVETDSDGVYEAHITKADGTATIVGVDASYNVTGEEAGGGGGHGGHGGPGGANDNDADDTGASAATGATQSG